MKPAGRWPIWASRDEPRRLDEAAPLEEIAHDPPQRFGALGLILLPPRPAVEAEWQTHCAVRDCAAKIKREARPTTPTDALRIVAFIKDATALHQRSPRVLEHRTDPGYSAAPYGLWENQIIALLGRVIDATPAPQTRKAA